MAAHFPVVFKTWRKKTKIMNGILNKKEAEKYLNRIGIFDSLKVNEETLNRLIKAHLTHVPFEAIDVWAQGSCPSLRIADLYEKIVMKNRGGYCFELNTLFRALLNSLGFEAYQVVASLIDEEGTVAPPAHNVIICKIDKIKYFVDVGFGGPVPFGAMELCDKTQLGFRIEKNDREYRLIRIESNKERPSILFRDIKARPSEFVPLNFYVSQNKDIHFSYRVMAIQNKPDGSVYRLMGDSFTITDKNGTVIKREAVNNKLEISRILDKYFNISPDTVSLREP